MMFDCDDHVVSIEDTYDVPLVYACITMWHETKEEMLQLLQSLLRLDLALEQTSRKNGTREKQMFKVQAHIFFDDGFVSGPAEEGLFNDYVRQLIALIEDRDRLTDFKHSVTPYGARLSWDMPGGSPLVVHVKDVKRIRKKKRWSQVFYIHYLLNWSASKGVAPSLDKTFILTLDGDAHFLPDSLFPMLDDLLRDPDVAAVCGRIHPVGSGPIVWYQKFEYAMGHWMYRATESVIGCILCTPGCFSMFKGSAIASGNILSQFETITTTATTYLMKDQGEDRWLCTLLLQNGHRVVYNSSAKAQTFCPDNIEEFYKQRRRWAPTILPNNLALLANWRTTTDQNRHITPLFLIYMMFLTVYQVIDSGCLFVMTVSVLTGTLPTLNPWYPVALNFLILGIYTLICLWCSNQTQMLTSKVLTVFYTVMQAFVFCILVWNLHNGIHSMATVYMLYFVSIVVVAGLLNFSEMMNLVYGLPCFLLIPSLWLMVTIYAVTNVHQVAWGTRQGSQMLKDADSSASQGKQLRSHSEQRYRFLYRKTMRYLRQLISGRFMPNKHQYVKLPVFIEEADHASQKPYNILKSKDLQRSWMQDPLLVRARQEVLDPNETIFLERLCKDHLTPLNETEILSKLNLRSLRNWATAAYCTTNALFILLIFSMQIYLPATSLQLTQGITLTVEPVTVVFLCFFPATLLQLASVLIYKSQRLLRGTNTPGRSIQHAWLQFCKITFNGLVWFSKKTRTVCNKR